MNLLLSGATGFVGRNFLLDALRDDRYEQVFLPVRDARKLKVQLAFERVDVSRIRILPWDAALPPDLCIDHAVLGAGVLFARNRSEYFAVNVEATRRLVGSLPAAARVLVLSSQSAGGPTPAGKGARSICDVDTPITFYGESKIAMESAVRALRPDAMILRPPMILGPRDRATLPLFRLAAGLVRPKPGLRAKSYSWIDVGDLVRAMRAILEHAAWSAIPIRTLYAAGPEALTDVDLIRSAATSLGSRGVLLPLPHPVLAAAARLVDAVPSLRAAAPSLTRDRVKEVFPDRWVVDAAEFRRLAGLANYATLGETLTRTLDWYRATGELPAASG